MKTTNSSMYRPTAVLHRAEKERAEFMFRANDKNSYDFLSLLPEGQYDSMDTEYGIIRPPANGIQPWRRRHKWKVGMAADSIHWGVYISRCSTEDDRKDRSSSRFEREGKVSNYVCIY